MAFTFVVEDGTVVANANSYVTVAEADDYLIANPHAWSSWSVLTNTTKQYYLAFATRYIDARAEFEGEKADPDSALRFPRTGCFTADEVEIPADEIPVGLRHATIEMARYLIDNDRTVERGQDGLKELQVDVVKLVFDENYRLAGVPSLIGYLLKGFGTISSGNRNFAKIRRA